MTPEDIEQAVIRLTNKYALLNGCRVDITRLVQSAIEAEREANVAKVLAFSNVLSNRLLPHHEANLLRYSLDHMFVALSLFLTGKLSLEEIQERGEVQS